MKWVFLATVCVCLVVISAAESPSNDVVVSLLLGHPSDVNVESSIARSKREEKVAAGVEVSARWGHKRRNKHRGGQDGQFQNYPTGFGGGFPSSGSFSSSQSQSQSWAVGGLTGSQSQSQSSGNSFGHGAVGSSAGSSANSQSFGHGGSQSQSQSEAQSNAQSGAGGSSSGAKSSASADGGFLFPGAYE